MFRRQMLGATAAAIALTAAGCKQDADGSASAAGDSAFDRIVNQQTLRAGFVIYPPSMTIAAGTGAKGGIMHDVMAALAANAHLTLNYVEELQWATMIQSVDDGRVDVVVSGIWPSSTRALHADFTRPVYFSAVHAYTRADDTRFDGNLAAANTPSVTIATLDGELSSLIAASDFPAAKTASLPQSQDVAQLLLQLTTRRADITFVEAAVAAAYLQKNPGTLRRVKGIGPVRVFPNTFLVKKGAGKLLGFLNVAIEELDNSGFIAEVLAKYDPAGTLFLRNARPYQL